MESSEVIDYSGEVVRSSYLYDHTGRRLKKDVQYFASREDANAGNGTVETTRTPFRDFEVTDTGNTKTSVMMNGTHVGTVEYLQGVRKIFFSHTDHLGSGSIITNALGFIVQVLGYFPFGSIRMSEQYEMALGGLKKFDERLKYTGHELDDETGLIYAQARYYDPEIGRFISQDPLQWRVGELVKFLEMPQVLNYYSYSINNPIIFYDPTGRLPDPTDVVVGGCLAFAPLCLAVKEAAETVLIAGGVALLTGGAAKTGAELAETYKGSQNSTILSQNRSNQDVAKAADAASIAAAGSSAASGGSITPNPNDPNDEIIKKINEISGKFGKVTENPGISIEKFSSHGLDQAITRGIGSQNIINTIRNPLVVLQQGSDKYVYISKAASVVIDNSGKFITAVGSSQFNNTVQEIVNLLK